MTRIIARPGTPVEPECIAPKPEHTDGPLVEYLVKRLGYGDDAPRHARFLAGLIADYHRERGFLIVSEEGFDEVLREKRRLADEVAALNRKVEWFGDQLAKGDKIASENADQYHADAALLRKELADANKRVDSMAETVASLEQENWKRLDETIALRESLKTTAAQRDHYKRLIVDAYVEANGIPS